MSLDPDRPIARCYKYDPLNKKHATNQDENLITVNESYKKNVFRQVCLIRRETIF